MTNHGYDKVVNHGCGSVVSLSYAANHGHDSGTNQGHGCAVKCG